MQIAVTDHAVQRYQQRVVSAENLDRESVRTVIREMVRTAFTNNTVRDHPGYPDRRMVPFTVGKQEFFLALGPNDTKFPGDWAVIGVLHDRELGKQGMGTTIGDLIPETVKQQLQEQVNEQPESNFLVRLGGAKSAEVYDCKDEKAVEDLLRRRRPNDLTRVEIFERVEAEIEQVFVVKRKK